jgi:hypothetical protein
MGRSVIALDEGKDVFVMRKLYVVVFALVALFVLGSAGTASATFCYQTTAFLGLSQKYVGKAECEAMGTETATGEWGLVWEWLVDGVAVPSTAPVHVEQTITDIELLNLGLGVTMLCAAADSLGIVWEQFDLVEEASALSCVTVAGFCPEPITIESDNLGWLTLLAEELGGMVRDYIYEDEGKGTPGWLVNCNNIVTDLCSLNGASKLTENMLAEVPKDVLANFDEGSSATCSNGGNQGEIKGEVLISALEGLNLEIN